MTKELSALDSVYHRVLTAKPDKLESLFDGLIVALLPRLQKNQNVVQKTSLILDLIDTRLRTESSLRLPTEKLIDYLKKASACDANATVISRSAHYIKIALDRENAPTRGRLVGQLVPCLSSLNLQGLSECSDEILLIILSAIQYVIVGRNSIWESLTEDGKAILYDFFLAVLLFNPNTVDISAGRSNLSTFQLFQEFTVAQSIRNQINVLNAISKGILPTNRSFILSLAGVSIGINHEVKKVAERNVESFKKMVNLEEDTDMLHECGLFFDPNSVRKFSPGQFRTELLRTIFNRSLAVCSDAGLVRRILSDSVFEHLTNDELRLQGLDFANRVSKICDKLYRTSEGETIYSFVFRGLRELIGNFDYSEDNNSGILLKRNNEIAREKIYSALGGIAQNRYKSSLQYSRLESPMADVALLDLLIRALRVDTKNTVSLQGCLSRLILEFIDKGVEAKEAVLHMIEMELFQSAIYSCRFIAAEWTRRLYKFSNLRARFIILCLCCDENLSVRTNACQGLPAQVNVDLGLFSALGHNKPQQICKIYTEPRLFKKEHDILLAQAEGFPSLSLVLEFLETNSSITEYCKRRPCVWGILIGFCLICMKKSSEPLDNTIVKSFIEMIQHGLEFSLESFDGLPEINELDQLYEEPRSVSNEITFHAVSKREILSLHEVAAKCIEEICSVQPALLLDLFDFEWFFSWLKHDSLVVRYSFAKSLPIILESKKNTPSDLFSPLLNKMNDTRPSNIHWRHGTLLCTGFLLYKNNVGFKFSEEQVEVLTSALLAAWLRKDGPKLIIGVALEGISLICRNITNGLQLSEMKKVELLQSLAVAIFKPSKDGKNFEAERGTEFAQNQDVLVEKAIKCIGDILFCEIQHKNQTNTGDRIQMLAFHLLLAAGDKHKNENLQCLIGDKLGVIASMNKEFGEFTLDCLLGPFPVSFSKFRSTLELEEGFIEYSSYILKDEDALLNTNNNRIRTSLLFWLLFIVRNIESSSSGIDLIVNRAQQIQAAFCILLRERGDVAREGAAMGVSLIYKLCYSQSVNGGVKDLKANLNRDLHFSRDSKQVRAMEKEVGSSQGTDGMKLVSKEDLIPEFKFFYKLATEQMKNLDWAYHFFYFFSRTSEFWAIIEDDLVIGGSHISPSSTEDFFVGAVVEKEASNFIIPVLFRAMFDTSRLVRNVLRKIWSSLTLKLVLLSPASKLVFNDIDTTMMSTLTQSSEDQRKLRFLLESRSKTQQRTCEGIIVKEHLPGILSEIIWSFKKRSYRERFSSTAALLSILSTPSIKIQAFNEKLDTFWEIALRVMEQDDVKMKTIGSKLIDKLAKITVHLSASPVPIVGKRKPLEEAVGLEGTNRFGHTVLTAEQLSNLSQEILQRDNVNLQLSSQENTQLRENIANLQQHLQDSGSLADDIADISNIGDEELPETQTLTDPELVLRVRERIIPFLMNTGLEVKTREVQIAVVNLVVKILEVSDIGISKYFPLMVSRLLESFSPLEHNMLKFMMARAKELKTTQDKLERMRVESMASSPMQTAISLCFDFLQVKGDIPRAELEGYFLEMVSSLPELLSHGTGLTSLAATAGAIHKIYSTDEISMRQDVNFRYTLLALVPKFLDTFKYGLHAKSTTLKMEYTRAIGAIIGFFVKADGEDISTIESFLDHVSKYFYESSADLKVKVILAQLFNDLFVEMEKQEKNEASTKVVFLLEKRLLPIIFIGKQSVDDDLFRNEYANAAEDEEKLTESEVALKFLSVWNSYGLSHLDISPSTNAFSSLLVACQQGLSSHSWVFRFQAGEALVELAKQCGKENSSSAPLLQVRTCCTFILHSLSGSFWTGKHMLLVSFSALYDVLSISSNEVEDLPSDKTLKSFLFPELSKPRSGKLYAACVFDAISTVIQHSQKNIEQSATDFILDQVSEHFERLKMEISLDADGQTLFQSAVHCVGIVWQPEVFWFQRSFDLLEDALIGTPATVHISVANSVKMILSKCSAQFLFEPGAERGKNLLDLLSTCLDSSNSSTVIMSCLQALQNYAALMKLPGSLLASLDVTRVEDMIIRFIRHHDPEISSLAKEINRQLKEK